MSEKMLLCWLVGNVVKFYIYIFLALKNIHTRTHAYTNHTTYAVSPMISVYRQMIYAEYGRTATLECLVEAFPEAIKYWERAYDGKILDPSDKYRIETYPDG